MIHEYAIEPELAVSWNTLDKIEIFKNKIGLGTGGIIANCPQNWFDLALNLLEKKYSRSASEMDFARAIVLIEEIYKTRINHDKLKWDDSKNWIQNILQENKRKAFDAILVNKNPTGNNKLLTETQFLKSNLNNINAKFEQTISRDFNSILSCVEPFLKYPTRVKFVDPYLRVSDTRYSNLIKRYLEIIAQNYENSTVEIYTAFKESNGILETKVRKAEKNKLKQFSKLIPQGVIKLFYLKNERPNIFHNRFILTNIGGIQFGYGLDCPLKMTKADDQVVRLQADTYLKLNDRYSSETTFFIKLFEGSFQNGNYKNMLGD